MTHDTTIHPAGSDWPTTAPARADDLRISGVSRISWGGVFAGTAVALVGELALNLLGVGIGVATLNPGTGDNPALSTASVSAGVWSVAAAILAVFFGAFVASRLSGRPDARTGALHGLTTWAVTTLVLIYLLTTAVGGLLGGVFGTLSSAVGGFGQAASQTVATTAPMLAKTGDPFDAIAEKVRNTTGGNDPEALKRTAVAAVKAAVTGDAAEQKAATDRAAEALAKAENVPVDQARQQVTDYEAQYRQAVATAKQKATEAADATVKAVSRGAFFAVIALALGALAAWFGGRAGTVRRETL